ncbi:MAG TPA: acyl-CoA dehydrogenase, partial [bacterium (Candidatus Stahlbacteria)]|nr:acyl-CoA dehydrogenase [Candidatus Stahlbacteria bacterium]
MDLELSQDQKLIKDMVRKFAAQELEPIASEIDKKQQFPLENIKKIAELGLLGMTVPEEYGGTALDTVSFAVAIEALSQVCASTGLIVAVHNSLGIYPIYLYGSEEQKRKYLIPLTKGEKLIAFGLTEPYVGNDLENMETKAFVDGNFYVVNGRKSFVTNGIVAAVYTIFAKVENSVSAFIVERNSEGLEVIKCENLIGMRGSGACNLIFENLKIPKENLLGKIGDGSTIVREALNLACIGLAAVSVGIAQAALDVAIQYSKERQQFGRPICKFPMVQEMLTDMATKILSSRLLTYDAALKRDSGKSFDKEAMMAKLCASDA